MAWYARTVVLVTFSLIAVDSIVLAHVLAHEITHILEDIPRHSESGVMKAWWTIADCDEMRRRPLAFASEDIELIHLGLAARARRSSAKSLERNQNGNLPVPVTSSFDNPEGLPLKKLSRWRSYRRSSERDAPVRCQQARRAEP